MDVIGKEISRAVIASGDDGLSYTVAVLFAADGSAPTVVHLPRLGRPSPWFVEEVPARFRHLATILKAQFGLTGHPEEKKR